MQASGESIHVKHTLILFAQTLSKKAYTSHSINLVSFPRPQTKFPRGNAKKAFRSPKGYDSSQSIQAKKKAVKTSKHMRQGR
jgi:hypothetical protein